MALFLAEKFTERNAVKITKLVSRRYIGEDECQRQGFSTMMLWRKI